MKNEVYVGFLERVINVDKEVLLISDLTIDLIKDVLPENVEASKLASMSWNVNEAYQLRFIHSDGGVVRIENNDENYNKYVQPYVDIWQSEKDKQDQEQEEAEAERNKFENRQARALTQLNADFETVKERAHIKSSLGFTVDANQTANENVNGLLVTISEGETVQFCDYYNQFHELTKADLETLQTEIIQNAQNLYQQKWVYRTQIENCTDNEGLDAVTATIEFTYMDFTAQAEEPTGDGEQAAETDQTTEQTE